MPYPTSAAFAATALVRLLPTGRQLPADAWRTRHLGLLAVLWLHVPVIAVAGLLGGYSVAHALGDALLPAVPALGAVVAGRLGARRRVRSLLVAVGLLSCSAVVVHLAEGTIEAHFHFFVVMSLLLLYEEWLIFLVASAYVVVHHGLLGTIAPASVFNHPGAFAHPWRWAAIHALFIAAASAANVVAWRLNERVRAEARHAQERAEESERLFRAAFEDAPIGVGFADLEGRWVHVNGAMCRVLGRSREQLLAETVGANAHPADAEADAAQLERLLRGEVESYQLEARVGSPEAWLWVLVSVSLARDAAGQPLHVIRHAQDITPRKMAEQSLQEAERRYRSLVEQLPLVVYVDNADDRSSNVYTSPQVTELVGYTPEEWVADPELFVKLLHPEDRERLVAEIGHELREPKPSTSEYRLIAREGRTVWVRDRSVPVFDDDGELVMMQGYLLDITQEKRLEEEARQSQKLEALGQLAGGVAHDFNNVLTGIQGYCSIARLRSAEGAPVDRELAEIGRAAEHAASLTTALLALSRKQVLQPERVHIDHLVGDLEGLLRRTIGEHVALTVELAAPGAAIEVDPGGIEHAVINLVVNARDAIGDGGRITLTTELVAVDGEASAELGLAPGRFVRLDVADDGHGIDEETLGRVFEPFFTTKAAGQGTGLGLSTVHSIVERSGGTVSVTSAAGEGTRFSVWLPAVAVADEPAESAHAAGPASAGGARLLVVEDEPLVRNVIAESLDLRGHEVVAVASADEALAVFADGGFELVLTDLNMPGMNGIELAAELVARQPGLRVLYASGYAADAISGLSLAENGAAFIAKPFDFGALAAKIDELLAPAGTVRGALAGAARSS